MLINLTGAAFMWIKALHIVSVIAWMAAILYLPRLFVYHADAEIGSQQSETFKIMERRLMRGIMGPSMIFALLFGVIMLGALDPSVWREGWLHVKLLAVVGLLALHGMCAKYRRMFAEDANTKSAKFYRVINEVPAGLMVIIVIFVVVKPF